MGSIQGWGHAIDRAGRFLMSGGSTTSITPYLQRVIRKGAFRSYVDIGAYTGDTTVPLARYFEKCVAVEPSPVSVEKLKKRIADAGLKNCAIEQCALGKYSGEGRLRMSRTNPEDNSLGKRNDLTAGPIVRIDTLDRIALSWELAEPIFIKIDVQGDELSVFQGGDKTLRRDCLIVSEFWPWGLRNCGSTPFEFINLVRSYGYHLYNLSGKALTNENIKHFCKRSEASRGWTDIVLTRGFTTLDTK